MIKIGMCDDNLNSIRIASKLLESETIEQNLDAEISIIFPSPPLAISLLSLMLYNKSPFLLYVFNIINYFLLSYQF